MAQKRPHPTDDDNDILNPNQTTFRGQPIYRSSPIHDRSSTFIALYSPSALFLSTPKTLQQHPDIQDASHRILAWRKRGKQLSLGFASTGKENLPGRSFETGSDDDGEKYAGRKVEAVLERMGVEGVVVVARWYGGVMLGPVRFKWIEDCAKEAIGFGEMERSMDGKRIKTGGGIDDVTATASGQGGSNGEERTTLDGAEEKKRLARILEKRDGSIDVLRSLLATRKEKLEGLQRSTSVKDQNSSAEAATEHETSTIKREQVPKTDQLTEQVPKSSQEDVKVKVSSPLKLVQTDYTSMSLQRLKQLEKARDATISWILKQIDAAEEKIRVEEEAESRGTAGKVAGDVELSRDEEEELLREFEDDDESESKS